MANRSADGPPLLCDGFIYRPAVRWVYGPKNAFTHGDKPLDRKENDRRATPLFLYWS